MAPHTPEELRATLAELVRRRRLAVLSTHRDGQPYASLVAFAATEDLAALFFATPRATRKFANLQADPRAALLITSSEDREEDFHAAMAATAVGAAEEIDGEERRRATTLYLAKHPYLEDFLAAPSCALMRFRPRAYILVRNFQHVMELHLGP